MKAGDRIGSYELLGSVGAGGMGEVYRARDTKLDREVALKLLPRDDVNDPDRLGRLRREARALASINHPHIATVHDFDEDGDVSFIVMELVEGPTLEDRLHEGVMSTVEALEVARQIAVAMEAAHRRGIVHRDLKPANVKVTRDSHVKVLDFGLAKWLKPMPTDGAGSHIETRTENVTRVGDVLGSPPYMSPEQARGDAFDERTDVWAFGCVLYEMLANARAFGRATVADTLAAVLTEEPDLTRLQPTTPVVIRRLLPRLLAKDPDGRIRSMSEVRSVLERAVTECATDRTDVPQRSTSARWMWGLTALTAVAAVLVIWLLTGRSAVIQPPDRSIAVLPFETLGQRVTTGFTDGVHGDMLTRLSRIGDLRVTSRTSVMQYQNPSRPLPEIAQELGVTWVLLGEVQEVGREVQVNARLINAAEDRQVWADRYRRELTVGNLFDIQNEITEQIARQLDAQLSAAQERARRQTRTDNLEAYRLYRQGVRSLELWTEDEMRKAAETFRRALDLDAEYALAWAGLADASSLLRWYGFEPVEGAPAPEVAARRALDLGPDLAEPHLSQAIVLSSSLVKDAPGALEELREAIRLQPSLGVAYVWMAWLHVLTGYPQAALKPAELAIKLDPLAPAPHVFLAEAYLANASYEDALAEARKGRQLQPEKPISHFVEALAAYHLGEPDAAEAALERALDLVPPQGRTPGRFQIRALLGVIAVQSGNKRAARQLVKDGDTRTNAASVGLLYAALGDDDNALRSFERVRSWDQMATLYVRYLFPEVLGSVRATPRYGEILHRIDTNWGVDSRLDR